MKTLLLANVHAPLRHGIRNSLLPLLLVIASVTYGGVPSMNVIVSDESGKVVFKGATNAHGTFAAENLHPGNYVVQFNSRSSAAVKGNHYLLVISAGIKKVIADAVPGEKLAADGVAMKLAVESNSKITGQIAREEAVASADKPNVRVINGKRYVWVTAETGSNLGGHWDEEGSPGAINVVGMSLGKVRQIQDRAFEGSMLNRMGPNHHHLGDR